MLPRLALEVQKVQQPIGCCTFCTFTGGRCRLVHCTSVAPLCTSHEIALFILQNEVFAYEYVLCKVERPPRYAMLRCLFLPFNRTCTSLVERFEGVQALAL